MSVAYCIGLVLALNNILRIEEHCNTEHTKELWSLNNECRVGPNGVPIHCWWGWKLMQSLWKLEWRLLYKTEHRTVI